MLRPAGVRFEKIYIAPEAPGQPSRGRKPSPQFLLDARDEFGLDLPSSYVIGDKLSDLECGWNAGVKKASWSAPATDGNSNRNMPAAGCGGDRG
jgi:histidinol phosphatase-like enzyme